MEKYAVILAGGVGHRAGGDVPKQFHRLGGRPLVWWAMKAFADADPGMRIVLVVHPDFVGRWQEMFMELPEADRIPHVIAFGGASRPESVANGLKTVNNAGATADSPVLIHDGARPLVSPGMIRRGLDALQASKGVIPAVATVNSLRELSNPGVAMEQAESRSVDRARFVEVQTPQIFNFSTIAHLYGNGEDISGFTDDASLAEAAGVEIGLYEGEATNIKVTHPLDFAIAEAILAAR